MPKKKNDKPMEPLTPAVIQDQPITETIEKNYMPYIMTVIVSRAIPEIDGFKPSHRKLLYTMYKMGLLGNTHRTKSANIVGETMKLNPHGDAAIYDTMVRLSRGYEALLHPYVDSKGNFGKFYSRDMAWAASRYTEAKLEDICNELFRDIDKDTVDFTDNYDGTLKEPTLLPASFPSVLVNANTGIAVGMASSICPFNIGEICETTIALMKDPQHDIAATLPAPDFPGGGQIICDRDALNAVYRTGRGSIRVRACYTYDKSNNCIDITQIPPSTTVEAIIEKVIELAKAGKVKEISDIRDETGLAGLKITIDLKRGADPDKLMGRLFRMTTLEDSFSCNFNVLIGGVPRVLGIRELLQEWVAFRVECVRRRTHFDLAKKRDRLHLLYGLQQILLDIDKAVQIVRSTEEESEVVPNLMIGFGIDEVQAEYVAEIKLRHLNREYILKQLNAVEELENEIADLEDILAKKNRVNTIIIQELRAVAKKYSQPRRSVLIYPTEEPEEEPEEIPDYPVHLFLTESGYFKKITPQSLRMSSEHKLKEGDRILQTADTTNNQELLFFTNRCQVYKTRLSEFDETKASVLGEFLPSKLGMDEGERPVYMAITRKYDGFMLFFFESGKVAKVDMQAYATKTNRRKLVGAYSDKEPLFCCYYIHEEQEFLMATVTGRRLLFHSASIQTKATKNTQGVAVLTLKRASRIGSIVPYTEGMLAKPHRYRPKTLPSAGQLSTPEESGEQLTLL
ncbi:MAG: topoisomerase IV [Clostridia bacterium]|nr:topoisomerase IV [Clostridia bacterium]